MVYYDFLFITRVLSMFQSDVFRTVFCCFSGIFRAYSFDSSPVGVCQRDTTSAKVRELMEGDSQIKKTYSSGKNINVGDLGRQSGYFESIKALIQNIAFQVFGFSQEEKPLPESQNRVASPDEISFWEKEYFAKERTIKGKEVEERMGEESIDPDLLKNLHLNRVQEKVFRKEWELRKAEWVVNKYITNPPKKTNEPFSRQQREILEEEVLKNWIDCAGFPHQLIEKMYYERLRVKASRPEG